MSMFAPENKTKTERNRRLYAIYEIIYTIVDFGAALLFFIGSIMFFYKSLENPAIWCFVIGSALFAFKPTIRVIRELHYLAIGDLKDLAERARS